ncbi:hypothetical protein B0H14DRAFT_3738153 [Mycena olivaceomarginata]|nr:hypothetical protein B0H14DRAFT_3738153 [Mycena olivaceomarginata]
MRNRRMMRQLTLTPPTPPPVPVQETIIVEREGIAAECDAVSAVALHPTAAALCTALADAPSQAQIPQRQALQALQPHGHGQLHLVRQYTIASPQEHLVCQQQQQRLSSVHSQPPAADDHAPEPAAACNTFACTGSTSTAAPALTSSTALGASAAALTPCTAFNAHRPPTASQSLTYHLPHSRLQHLLHSSYLQPSAQSHRTGTIHTRHHPISHSNSNINRRRQGGSRIPSLRLRLSCRPSCSTSPSLIHNNIKLNATDTHLISSI